MMTPSETIVAAARRRYEVVDSQGRHLTLRGLTALDTLRLFKAAGPVLAQNQPWISLATLAMSVTEIDGIPLPTPVTEAQIEAIVERLGDAGLTAIADALDTEERGGVAATTSGNSQSTPS
jgi:hypothetical protein